MKPKVKRRILSYLVLIAMAVGLLYFLRASPVQTELVVTLDGARLLGDQKLVELKLSIYSGDDWVSSTTFNFDPSAFPNGPPAQTHPIRLELKPGEYEARLGLVYGPGPQTRMGPRRSTFEVKEGGTIRIRGAQ